MRVYTELVLGKTDPGLRAPEMPIDITKAYDSAALIDTLVFDGIVSTETKEDPFMVLALAAQASEKVSLATSVAIAFPRSPAVTAMSAWNLQRLSAGRFTLGLGPQVRGHIKRRFGLEPHPMGPWMRDYARAVRAVWDCWQNGTDLDFESEHYKLNLMVPLFDPGPIEHPDIPIHLAALNTYMCRVAGEVGDGMRPHPVCTPKYIQEVMKPAFAKGAEIAGRDPDALAIAMKPLVATAPNEESLQARIKEVRARVSFYASTPTYRKAFDIFGLGELAEKLSHLSRAQKWDEMPSFIDDDVLNTYAVVGTYEEIGQKIVDRFEGVLTDVGFSIQVNNPGDKEILMDMLRKIQAGSSSN